MPCHVHVHAMPCHVMMQCSVSSRHAMQSCVMVSWPRSRQSCQEELLRSERQTRTGPVIGRSRPLTLTPTSSPRPCAEASSVWLRSAANWRGTGVDRRQRIQRQQWWWAFWRVCRGDALADESTSSARNATLCARNRRWASASPWRSTASVAAASTMATSSPSSSGPHVCGTSCIACIRSSSGRSRLRWRIRAVAERSRPPLTSALNAMVAVTGRICAARVGGSGSRSRRDSSIALNPLPRPAMTSCASRRMPFSNALVPGTDPGGWYGAAALGCLLVFDFGILHDGARP